MALTTENMTTHRTIEQLGYDVSEDVVHAIELLKTRYGASSYRDSGHQLGKGGRPTWIFELPRFGAEIGVPMNRRDLTLYMRNRTLDGRKLTDLLPAGKVVKVYPRDGKPARGIKDSAFLGTAKGNESVMLALDRGDLESLFQSFFAVPATANPLTPASAPAVVPKAGAKRPPIDADAFEALMERRSEVGQAGELLAVQDELDRLSRLGCPEPHRWVERVALVDVGRGYDIASTWPGQVRCIEVKASTRAGADFFVTENECKVLATLGSNAWLYRVSVNADGTGAVVHQLRDPMRALPDVEFRPVVYRVQAEALTRALATSTTT